MDVGVHQQRRLIWNSSGAEALWIVVCRHVLDLGVNNNGHYFENEDKNGLDEIGCGSVALL